MTNDRKKAKAAKLQPKSSTTDQKFGHVFKSTFRGLVEDGEMEPNETPDSIKLRAKAALSKANQVRAIMNDAFCLETKPKKP